MGIPRFCILLLGISLWACFCVPAMCQDTGKGSLVITADMLWDYTRELMDKKDYATAQTELKRLVHFFPSDQRILQARLDIGISLFHTGQYMEAAKICNEIMLDMPMDDVGQQSCFLQSLCFEKMGNIGYAALVLHNYLTLVQAEDIQNRALEDRICFHLGRLYLADGTRTGDLKTFEKAEQFFLRISSGGSRLYDVGQYLDSIVMVRELPRKHPGLGAALSLVPGAGFLYTHRLHDAFAAFIVNAGLAAAACKAWDQDNRALAGILAFVETGFYTGNIYGSISSVHKYNRKQMADVLRDRVSLSPVAGDAEYGVMLHIPF